MTSAEDTIDNIRKIHDKSEDSENIVSTQIAFSKAGLEALDMYDAIGDPHFDQGSMRNEKYILGDRCDWDPVFDDAVKNDFVRFLHSATVRVE